MYRIDACHSRHPVKMSVILFVVGVLFLLFGFLIETPAALYFSASLFFTGSPISALGADPATVQGLFLLASVLIVFGAGVDVWRRLHLLHR